MHNNGKEREIDKTLINDEPLRNWKRMLSELMEGKEPMNNNIHQRQPYFHSKYSKEEKERYLNRMIDKRINFILKR